MAHYRIYLLDPVGRFISGYDAACENDAEALTHAETLLLPPLRAEVWNGTRPVGEVASPARPEAIEPTTTASPAAPRLRRLFRRVGP